MNRNEMAIKAVKIRPLDETREKIMDIALFYILACAFMGISAMLSGLQWNEANGIRDYLRLILVDKPFIPIVTIIIFAMSGVMMQVGKHHFSLSYYEISVIWLATSWVSIAVLWGWGDIKPSWAELTGIIFCHIGLAIMTLARILPKT